MLNQIDLSRADLNLLVLFEVVRNERHVGRAAERLNLSPSAVSHGLGRLRRLLNDPLFLKTPKGVVPAARADELAEPIADVLARAQRVIASAEPFDPKTSARRFALGAPDGISAVLLPPLLAEIQRVAPGIDIGVRHLLPQGGRTVARAWEPALADLDARATDIAILPLDDVPARFVERPLYEEEFAMAVRAGHPFAIAPTLDRYCRAQHLVVSLIGDAHGFVDDALAARGRSRRVALTVPNFMVALATVAETDLITAMPRRLLDMHAPRFGLTSIATPLPLPRFRVRAIASKAAMMDAGVTWLFQLIERVSQSVPGKGRRPSGRRRR
jgi:DNA-binding transcriptional LysR family regulator